MGVSGPTSYYPPVPGINSPLAATFNPLKPMRPSAPAAQQHMAPSPAGPGPASGAYWLYPSQYQYGRISTARRWGRFMKRMAMWAGLALAILTAPLWIPVAFVTSPVWVPLMLIAGEAVDCIGNLH